MPEADSPQLDKQTLIHFLRDRPALSVMEAAHLLGWPARALLRRAREEEAVLENGRIAWSEVAFWLLETLPRALLLRTLGDEAHLLPPGLHLIEVTWRLPLYIVRAAEREASLRHMTVDDYIAEALDIFVDGDAEASF